MADGFRGTALPLDADGIAAVTEQLSVGAPEVWAILSVETRGCGFLPDRRPLILFERHIFSRETKRTFDNQAPDISNRTSGGYGAPGAAQYERLERAIALDRKAALRSASWGIGQVMGFNARSAGYADVEDLVSAMIASENTQLLAMSGEIKTNRLDRALRSHDWASFARGYNGAAYAKNRYDTRLAAAYQKYVLGPLPDLAVRMAQIYLTYLGFNPGAVDGLLGRFTRSAVNEFRMQLGMNDTTDIDEETITLLRREVEKLV